MIAAVHGEGIPLFLVHGFGVDHRILLPLERSVGSERWQRIYIDLPWAERATDTGERTPRQLADTVLDEVVRTVGDGPFAILGNSFGALLARHVSHALPEQCLGVATLAGVLQPDHARRTLPAREVVVHDPEVLDRAGQWRGAFEEMTVLQTPTMLRDFEEYVRPGLRGCDQHVLDRLSASYTDAYSPETEAASAFPAPALHLFGRQDQVVGYEDGLAFQHHYPHGTFVVLDGAGHNLHLEQPEVVGALVRDWLHRAENF